ncbi:hypothetical protein BKA66DRAFT_453884 [Pyrenochaeta sp. MPI-SDFR-AT-0127]|nr:hypothetical protein BKA66DRAFT_453884 [Pyrenochaeta sp. MPI-SDFR-AT-0127]
MEVMAKSFRHCKAGSYTSRPLALTTINKTAHPWLPISSVTQPHIANWKSRGCRSLNDLPVVVKTPRTQEDQVTEGSLHSLG